MQKDTPSDKDSFLINFPCLLCLNRTHAKSVGKAVLLHIGQVRRGESLKVVIKEIAGDVNVLYRGGERSEKDKGTRKRFEGRTEDALGKSGRNIENGRRKNMGKTEQKIGRVKGTDRDKADPGGNC